MASVTTVGRGTYHEGNLSPHLKWLSPHYEVFSVEERCGEEVTRQTLAGVLLTVRIGLDLCLPTRPLEFAAEAVQHHERQGKGEHKC